MAPRDLPEVGELDFERDGAPTSPRALAVAPDRVDDLSKRITRSRVGEEVYGKRVLGADGFANPIGAYGPLVDAARDPVKVGARLPEILLQENPGFSP